MSQRVKKPGRSADDSQGKRRRRRPSGSDVDEDGTRSGSNSGGNGSLTGMWTPRHLNDLKVSSIYNRNSAEAPAELYRKDLISAMKLPDSEPLTPEEYWLITDSWKQEWEKGVQVPVNPESLPEPEVKLITPVAERSHDFRLPKKKYVRVTHDDFFNPDYHQLVSTAARAEKVCSYDLDDVDAAWLGCSNADRAMQNSTVISEFLMEQVIEELELQCWEQVQTILKSQEGLGIEYDENVICDVCRSPESEEGNEMVFCDSCNICVHQACYGITTIPSGSWLCRTCTLGIKPACVLCPNVGGAMKATRSGHTWAHVACAIWIPEVSIGSVEKMEPITKISSIPQSRWSLVCVICKEKTGACIQCSVKTCKTAYHVTCAFKNGLEMKPIIVDENAEDGIKLRSYCLKHSVNTKKDKSQSGSEDDAEKKKMKAMTAEERNQARAEKLQQIEAEFYKYVRLKDVSQNLAVDMDVVILIYNYWKLKRKSLNNRPLVPPRPETTQLLTQQQEQDLEQMKMFVQLRQDLERVRNLCYMVSRREKLSRSFFRLREQTFQKQLALLSEKNDLTPEDRQAILQANHGPSIYDQFYSHSSTPSIKSSLPDYEALLSLIAGVDAKKEGLVNGVVKSKKPSTITTSSKQAASTSAAVVVNSAQNKAEVSSNANSNSSNSASANSVVNNNNNNNTNSTERTGPNPYKKQFVNGARRRNLLGGESGSSHSESEACERAATGGAPPAAPSNKKTAGAKAVAAAKNANNAKGGNRKPLSYLFDSDSSADAGAAATPAATPGKKGAANKVKGKVKGKAAAVKNGNKSTVRTTSYLSDSDELELPVGRGTNKNGGNAAGTVKEPIYSDSESEGTKVIPAVSGKKETKAGKSAAAKERIGKKSKTAVASGDSPDLASKQPRTSEESTSVADIKVKKAKEKGSPLTSTPKGKSKATGKKGKKKDFDPTELIVPQREAAKKATESIRSVKQKTKDQATIDTIEAVATGTACTVVKETQDSSNTKEKTKSSTSVTVSTLSDSEGEEKDIKPPLVVPKKTEKAKSPERKVSAKSTKKASAAAAAAALENSDLETGDGKDEFDFDADKEDSSKNVSYVPQRQAAKKAAEHIRSGLSNVVVARLIIEDEMELARKKQKLEKNAKGATSKSPTRKSEEDTEESRVPAIDCAKIETAVAEAAKKVTSKERAPAKGATAKATKTAKKEPLQAEREQPAAAGKAAGASKDARGIRETDLPFLDKGSQSASRRSRERSSSSSSSGSSGSSSSGSSCSSRSSSSSSRSSSAESASPEPSSPVVTKKASNQQISPISSKLPNTTQEAGPGRKLKTSERVPNRRLRAETPPREKPAAKGSRPTKSGSGRGDPFRSAFSPSPEPQSAKERSSSPEPDQQRNDDSKRTVSRHNKVSPVTSGHTPVRKSNEQQQLQQRVTKSKSRSPVRKGVAAESQEKKGTRRKGESSKVTQQIEKDNDTETAIATRTSRAAAGSKRPSAKALASSRKSPVKHTGPRLSSESESESAPPPPAQKDSQSTTGKLDTAQVLSPGSRSRNNSQSSQPPNEATTTASPSPKVATKRKTTCEGNIGLSDSEESGTEEKENSCVASESQPRSDNHPSTPVSSRTPKSQKNSAPVPSGSILSPLTPSDNKDKEQQQVLSRLSDTEPETKRPRLDPSATPTNSTCQSGNASTQQPSLAPSTSGSGTQQLKSIFSPPGNGREGEILDFDSELYDLARSVTEDYPAGDDAPSSGSLSFSFSQELFTREDNKEDSARATLNLVEKLRLQHARKSGIHRPSTESSSDVCDNLLEDMPLKSPVDKKLDDDDRESIASLNATEEKTHQPSFESSITSPSVLHTAASPDRSKSVQGDERWVPPSHGHVRPPQHPSHNTSPSSNPSILTTISIPNAVSSPRTPYVNIPESSPPIPVSSQPSQQSHPRLSGRDRAKGSLSANTPQISPDAVINAESDKHRVRSPPFAHLQSSTRSARSHSRSSADNDKAESLKHQHQLSVDTVNSPQATPPRVSPVIPGHHGRALPFENSHLAGLPFGSNPFLHHTLAGNPVLASALAAAAAAGENPAAAAFASLLATQVPIPKTSPGLLGHFPENSFPTFMPVLQAQQQQLPPHGQGHTQIPPGRLPPAPPTVHSSSPSPAGQRRPSESLEGKLPLSSPLVSVSTSMPPLAKPPLTSPSVLLAANNVKTVTPHPLQSAVAHIIESVVNNHAGSASNNTAASNQLNTTSMGGLPKTTLSLDMHLHPVATTSAVAPTSTNPLNAKASLAMPVKTPLASPVMAAVIKQQAHTNDPAIVTDFSAVLVNKTTENIIIPKAGRDSRDSPADRTPVPTSNAASPKASSTGRGRRASTPRAVAIKAEKLSGVNAVIEDMISPAKSKGRGERKPASSPGRGKVPSTPRQRGQGRGKGKGKNLVGLRKDLAGTVYDIDFDEFEENSEEKIDLRALRERRKSSEVHSNAAVDLKHLKSSDLTTSSPLTLPVHHGEKQSRHSSRPLAVDKEKDRDHNRNTSHSRGGEAHIKQPPQTQQVANIMKTEPGSSISIPSPLVSPSDKNIHPILQAPLPGPVDMRTYSSSTSSAAGVTGEETATCKIGFPHAKDPSSEIASLFMSSSTGSGGAAIVNDLEELDKALEVLVAAPKPPSSTPTGSMSGPNATSVTAASSAPTSQPPSHSAVTDVISNVSNSSQLKLQNNTQQPTATVNNIISGAGFGQVPYAASKESADILPFNNAPVGAGQLPPAATAAEGSGIGGDLSRNQLKVKIKGPFLDANYSSTNSMPGQTGHHLQHHQSSAVPGHFSGSFPSTTPYTQDSSYPQGHQHHQQYMMSSMMNNTSNLRRMRKKELLRQYWTQDMNMDGGSNSGYPVSSASDMSGYPPSSATHPISRSVITIPKAVASMSILPTKEDYRLDNPDGNDSNDSNELGFSGSITLKGALGVGSGGTEKKRRSRGIYREMAALGIIHPDAPRERRRERAAAAASSASVTSDSNSRKRIRGNKQPLSRSTFIPPTLVESVDSPGGKSDKGGNSNSASSSTSGIGLKPGNNGSTSGSSAVSAVVNVVNHPTPKLKIKFGEMTSSSAMMASSSTQPGSGYSSLYNNTNHLSDSDKEAPNKKAKGRPPKKRGLPDTSAAAPPSMEELKRQSMKFRELVMQEFAMEDQKEILKLSGTRRGKKKKRKAGASAGSETDDSSVRSKSPGMKVTAVDGPTPKLILRLGKSRPSATRSESSASATSGVENSSSTSNNNGNSGKPNENGLPGSDNSSQGPSNLDTMENDSGFTGSSEGSSGSSLSEPLATNSNENGKRDNREKSTTNNNNNNNNSSSSDGPSSSSIRNGSGGDGSNGDKVLVLELDKTSDKLTNFSASSSNQFSTKGKLPSDTSSTATSGIVGGSAGQKSSSANHVPIRLKLSRCYEGYSLKTKKDALGVDVVDRENGGASNAAKQSDSCQVR